MILQIMQIVMPVFLIIGAGYFARRLSLFDDAHIDGLMIFTQKIAIPCLLYKAIASLDLGAVFDLGLLISFYSGAVFAFALGVLGARILFQRRPGEAVAVGFGALFSNSVLLGLPIMERAYGAESLAPNFAIISIHAPFCYFLGIAMMEFSRADGRGLVGTARAIFHAMFRNALMIGLALGFVVNLGEIAVPATVTSAVDMITRAALPTALFALGGILTRYSIRASLMEAGYISALSLFLHPAIALLMSHYVFELSPGFVTSAVVTAAMAPGVNAYVFASMYQRGQAQAASMVLLATAASIITASLWLAILHKVVG